MEELSRDELRELRRKARAAVLEALGGLGGEAMRAAIVERALATGGFTTREMTAPGPPAKLDAYPRRIEYELSWALTRLKKDGLLANPRWSVWALAGAAAEPVEPPLAAPALEDRIAQLREMPHRDYLRTPEWRETRAAALVRAGNACAMDVTHTGQLDVHHRTYANVGAERPADLVVLCRSCHELHHRAHGRPRRSHAPGPSAPPPAPRPPRAQSLLRRLFAG